MLTPKFIVGVVVVITAVFIVYISTAFFWPMRLMLWSSTFGLVYYGVKMMEPERLVLVLANMYEHDRTRLYRRLGRLSVFMATFFLGLGLLMVLFGAGSGASQAVLVFIGLVNLWLSRTFYGKAKKIEGGMDRDGM